MTMPSLTPGKKPFTVPPALADAIAAEWNGKKVFNASAMPLTVLAYTAIDYAAEQKDPCIEVLLAYVDTDTLCYRSSASPQLFERQQKQWDPVLHWAGNTFSAMWQTTTGVMPLTQPAALHEALKAHLQKMDAMHLAACTVLASLCSSLVLALAVVEKQLPPRQAFILSRLEESFSAEQWGEDEEAARRAQGILKEIEAVGRFLSALDRV